MNSTVEYIDGMFVCTASGNATVNAVADLFDAMLSHERWKPGTPFFHDISMVDAGSLNPEDVARIAELAGERKALLGVGKIAVIANRDLEYGIARMIGGYMPAAVESEFAVFRSRGEALAWLAA